jgi:hypothetical protein
VAAAARITEMIFGVNITARPNRMKDPTTPIKPIEEVKRSPAANGNVTPVKSTPAAPNTNCPMIKFLLRMNKVIFY